MSSVTEPQGEDEAGILAELREQMDNAKIVTLVQEIGGLRVEATSGMSANDVLATLLRAIIFQVFEEWDMDFEDEDDDEED